MATCTMTSVNLQRRRLILIGRAVVYHYNNIIIFRNQFPNDLLQSN